MLRHLFIVSLVMCLSACGSSPKTHFYMLSAKNQSTASSVYTAEQVRIGVWVIKLPDFLDRSEIVTRNGQHAIELADFHKWADRLGDNMTRLIAGELGQRLKTGQVVISPWSSYTNNDYQVRISIDRFDGERGGEVILNGFWSLLNGEGKNELIREAFTFKEQAASIEYDDMVVTLSHLTVQLAEKISDAIAIRRYPQE